eukprot:TRINITY_DN84554_c0_g1_i1.p1 TRINITY_DN84554_c0_g1~~TRINITY_DN84554_c0_g1_i1.p1  ORF type:complete len:589 (-),score=40.93 TRINITY_DN84554_c0_g1_i1:23-1789(-)
MTDDRRSPLQSLAEDEVMGSLAAGTSALPSTTTSSMQSLAVVECDSVVSMPGRTRQHTRSFSTQAIFPEAVVDDVEASERNNVVPKRRIYYLDWMRVMAIYLVVFYHIVQALDWIGLWCGYDRQQDISFRCVALQIGMPLFFHISGRAQALAKPGRLTVLVQRRAVRLLLPFVVCFCVLIPPWRWVHERDLMETCVAKTSPECVPDPSRGTQSLLTSCFNPPTWTPNPDVPQNLLVYIFKFYTGEFFELDPAWLWFLPILYIVTVSSTPLFLWGEHKEPIYLVLTVLWLLLQAVAVRLLGSAYSWSFIFFLALPVLGVAVLVHLIPFPDQNATNSPDDLWQRFKTINGVTMLYIVSTIGLVQSFSYAGIDQHSGYSDNPLRTIPQMFFYPLFYSHGYFAQRWWPESSSSKRIFDEPTPRNNVNSNDSANLSSTDSKRKVIVKVFQLLLCIMMFLGIFIGSPIGDWEFSSWPVYSKSFHHNEDFYSIGYVFGTWIWIGIAEALCQAYLDTVIHETIHQHASASTIVVYIFHWAILKPFVWFWVRDLQLTTGHWKFFAPLLTGLVTIGGSLGIYALLARYPRVGAVFGVA